MSYRKYLKSYNWHCIRKKVIERDNDICQCCGDKNCVLQVHHIKYNSLIMSGKDISHLITLCANCHHKVESIKKKYAILIFDDGLQDSQIDYDKKLVCFKSDNWIGNGQIIPAGPLREKISSLKRFDAIFLNAIYVIVCIFCQQKARIYQCCFNYCLKGLKMALKTAVIVRPFLEPFVGRARPNWPPKIKEFFSKKG